MRHANLIGFYSLFGDHPISRYIVGALLFLWDHTAVIDLACHGHTLCLAYLNISHACFHTIVTNANCSRTYFRLTNRHFVLNRYLYLLRLITRYRNLLRNHLGYINRTTCSPHHRTTTRIAGRNLNVLIHPAAGITTNGLHDSDWYPTTCGLLCLSHFDLWNLDGVRLCNILPDGNLHLVGLRNGARDGSHHIVFFDARPLFRNHHGHITRAGRRFRDPFVNRIFSFSRFIAIFGHRTHFCFSHHLRAHHCPLNILRTGGGLGFYDRIC